jgi:hypothetical protein
MVNNTRNLSTSKELNVEFSLPNATLFGGALPLLNYVKKLKVTKLFEEALTFFKGPNSTYHLPQGRIIHNSKSRIIILIIILFSLFS